ncbi:MAG: tricarballylate utilization 4Fe-4S protein TcuB [Bryobacteraceae bacterium]
MSAKPALHQIELTPTAREAERLMVICNACRYCEGYCAVFPAMERRLNFAQADLDYLANLCHNCAECYYACQYAPPHEFAVNVPRVFAELRAETYKKYAWPGPLAALFRGKRIVIPWIIGLAALVLSVANPAGTAFYDVIPHEAMVSIFLAVSALIVSAHVAGFIRFWKGAGETVSEFLNPTAIAQAAADVLSMKNLSSGGVGCTYPNERHSQARRIFHHFTFYGFLLCFASTTVAALYHFTGSVAPYSYTSVPVVLGTLGGIGLLIGPIGLYSLKRSRDPRIVDPAQDGSDIDFLGLLFFTSFTGLMLLAMRGTAVMGPLLIVHLAVVLCLFLTLPYGKFVHGIYRSAALVKNALETMRKKP